MHFDENLTKMMNILAIVAVETFAKEDVMIMHVTETDIRFN